jgi:hypothetical protein
MTTQKEPNIFRTPGMSRAQRLLKDVAAWHLDQAEERAAMEKELEIIEAEAEQARRAVLAGDSVKIIKAAMRVFGGQNAEITEHGDILIHRADVVWSIDDVSLIAFLRGGYVDRRRDDAIRLPDLSELVI